MSETKDRLVEAALRLTQRRAVAIRLRRLRPGDRSQLGGYPSWPVGVPFPKDDEGRDEIFALQIALSDLPWRPSQWPDEGILYLFLSGDVKQGSEAGKQTPLVYFATPDQQLSQHRPDIPYPHDVSIAPSAKGRLRHSLLAFGLDFVAFEDHHIPSLEEPTSALRHKMEKSLGGASISDDAWGTLTTSVDEAKVSNVYAARGKPDANKGTSDALTYGGFALLDPDHAIRRGYLVPRDGPTENDKRRMQPEHPFFERWPHTWGTVHFQLRKVLQALDDYKKGRRGRRPPQIKPPLETLLAEAQEWRDRVAPHLAEGLISEGLRAEYRSWCTGAYQRAAKEFRRGEPWYASIPLISVRKFFGSFQSEEERKWRWTNRYGYMLFAEKLGSMMYVASRQDLATLPHDALTDAELDAIGGGRSAGQLFGYGFEVQYEIDEHIDRLTLAALDDIPSASLGGGDVKFWLPHGPLVPNAWQEATAECNV